MKTSVLAVALLGLSAAADAGAPGLLPTPLSNPLTVLFLGAFVLSAARPLARALHRAEQLRRAAALAHCSRR